MVVILVRQGKLTYSDVLVAQILKKEKKRISFLRTVKTQSVSATFHNEAFINTLEENASKPVPMSFQSIYFCLSGMIQLHNLLRPKAVSFLYFQTCFNDAKLSGGDLVEIRLE